MFSGQVNRLMWNANFARRANSLTAGFSSWYRDSGLGERQRWSRPYLVLHTGHLRCCFGAVVPEGGAHTLLPREMRGKRGAAQPHARHAHHAWSVTALRHRKPPPNMGGDVFPPRWWHDAPTHFQKTNKQLNKSDISEKNTNNNMLNNHFTSIKLLFSLFCD